MNRRAIRRATAMAMAILFAGAIAACNEPARDRVSRQLGSEDPAVPVGPLHRPGQPCVLCHDGDEARALSFGGTVYWSEDSDKPAVGATVDLVDSLGVRFSATTNCAGNFFTFPEDFLPRYPVWVSLHRGDWEIAMESPINGNGSCATCHEHQKGPESAGFVYLYVIAPGEPPPECK